MYLWVVAPSSSYSTDCGRRCFEAFDFVCDLCDISYDAKGGSLSVSDEKSSELLSKAGIYSDRILTTYWIFFSEPRLKVCRLSRTE